MAQTTVATTVTDALRLVVSDAASHIRVTDDTDAAHAIEATSEFLTPTDARFELALAHVVSRVFLNVQRYGDFGHDGNPEGLDRFPYWFKQLDTDALAAFIAKIEPKPPAVELTASVKPPSGASKCTKCKTKFARGQKMLVHRRVHAAVDPTLPVQFGGRHFGMWRVTEVERVCESCRVPFAALLAALSEAEVGKKRAREGES